MAAIEKSSRREWGRDIRGYFDFIPCRNTAARCNSVKLFCQALIGKNNFWSPVVDNATQWVRWLEALALSSSQRVLKFCGVFPSHTSHLFLCSLTDGAARILFNLLIEHARAPFQCVWVQFFPNSYTQEGEKTIWIDSDCGKRTPASCVASKCAIHYTIASQAKGSLR